MNWIELLSICIHYSWDWGPGEHFRPAQKELGASWEGGGGKGKGRAWYLSPALGEKQRVFQHHVETAQHFLLAVASFGLQLRGTAGDHGGGELGREGCESKPRPQPSAHRDWIQLGAPSTRRPLPRTATPARGIRFPARRPHLPGVAVPLTPERHRCSPRTLLILHTETPGAGRRAKRDNLHSGRVSAQKQKGKERGVVWANLLKTRNAGAQGCWGTILRLWRKPEDKTEQNCGLNLS